MADGRWQSCPRETLFCRLLQRRGQHTGREAHALHRPVLEVGCLRFDMRTCCFAVLLIATAASVPQVQTSAEFDAAAQALLRQYVDAGQPPVETEKVRDFFVTQAQRPEAGSEIRLRASHYLQLIGDADASAALFRSVPDADLRDPPDLVRRLRELRAEESSRVVALLRRLADVGKGGSDSDFVSALHGVLAPQWYLAVQGEGLTDSHWAVIRYLHELSAVNAQVREAMSGLSTWLEAQYATDPARLIQLARKPLAGTASWSPRYRLLLATCLDKAASKVLRDEARRIRQETIASIRQHRHGGPSLPELSYPTGVLDYWVAYSYRAEAEALRRETEVSTDQRLQNLAQVPSAEGNAALTMRLGVRSNEEEWASEARFFGSAPFIADYAAAREETTALRASRGDHAAAESSRSIALNELAYLTEIDGNAITLFKAAVSRLRPDASWQPLWEDSLLPYRRSIPPHIVLETSTKPLRYEWPADRWTLFIGWKPLCATCVDIRTVQTLSQRRAGIVVVAIDEDKERADRYFSWRAGGFSVGHSPASALKHMQMADLLNRPYLVSPDGRVLRMPTMGWEFLAEEFLKARSPE